MISSYCTNSKVKKKNKETKKAWSLPKLPRRTAFPVAVSFSNFSFQSLQSLWSLLRIAGRPLALGRTLVFLISLHPVLRLLHTGPSMWATGLWGGGILILLGGLMGRVIEKVAGLLAGWNYAYIPIILGMHLRRNYRAVKKKNATRGARLHPRSTWVYLEIEGKIEYINEKIIFHAGVCHFHP